MAGAKFQYDDEGGTFFYFLLSLIALVIIPCTYYFWPEEDKKDNSRHRKKCHCEQCGIKEDLILAKEPWRKVKHRTIKFLLIIGWIALFACAYKCAHLQHDYINWDPFEILEIDPASSTAEIKKAYRKLSLIYHPDKETGDERKFMRISKAYAALTDEDARKNWEMYGNPDGPGATSFGIALPSWIVEKENSIVVLGIYALVFMIALPTIVGIWWYRSVKYGGEQVLLDTTQLYYCFIHKTPHMMLKRVIMIVAASLEFERNHNGEVVERPTDNIEVPQLIKSFNNLGEKNKERPLCFGYSIKARALMYAHLSRMKLPPKSLDIDKNYIIRKCPSLIQEFVQCVAQLTMLALAGRIARIPSLETIEHAMKFSPLIVQALWDSKSPLLQLPHVNEDSLRFFNSKKRNVKTLKQLAALRDDERRELLRGFNDRQYQDIVTVLGDMPHIVMNVTSQVLDDEESGTITAGAIATVTVLLKRKSLSAMFGKKATTPAITQNGDVSENTKLIPNGDANDENTEKKEGRSELKVKKSQWKPKPKAKAKGGKGKKRPAPQKQGRRNPAEQAQAEKEKPKSKQESESEHSDFSDNESEVSGQSEASDVEERKDDSAPSEEEDEAWEKLQQRVNKKEKALETKSKQSHTVHCPYFVDDKQEYWWIYLADKKRDALTTFPVFMTNLVDKEEIELKFTAPGVYTYTVIVRSDSYVDFDVSKQFKLDVKEAKEIVHHPQWDFPEEEEEEAEKDEDSAVEDSDLIDDSDEDSDGLDPED